MSPTRLVRTHLVLPPIPNSLNFLKFGKDTQAILSSNGAAQTIFSLFQQIWADCRDLLNNGSGKAAFQIKVISIVHLKTLMNGFKMCSNV